MKAVSHHSKDKYAAGRSSITQEATSPRAVMPSYALPLGTKATNIPGGALGGKAASLESSHSTQSSNALTATSSCSTSTRNGNTGGFKIPNAPVNSLLPAKKEFRFPQEHNTEAEEDGVSSTDIIIRKVDVDFDEGEMSETESNTNETESNTNETEATTDRQGQFGKTKSALVERRGSHHVVHVVRERRKTRAQSMDERIKNMSDEEIQQLEQLKRRVQKERQKKRDSACVDYVARNAQHVAEFKKESKGTDGASDSHSKPSSLTSSCSVTPLQQPLLGGSLSSFPGLEQESTNGRSRVSRTNSAINAHAQLSQQRQKEGFLERASKVEDREHRFNPEVVRQKRWMETCCLILVTKHWIQHGLQHLKDQSREAFANRVLADLFLPRWRFYRHRKLQRAEELIQRFICRVVIKQRVKRRDAAVDTVSHFLQHKLKYIRQVFTHYACKVRKAQFLLRRMMLRRDCQVELNYRRLRHIEETTYWKEARILQDQAGAAQYLQQIGERRRSLQLGQSPASSLTNSPNPKTSPSRTEGRQLPERLLRRQARDLISKKSREYHREVIRCESFRRSPSTPPTKHVEPSTSTWSRVSCLRLPCPPHSFGSNPIAATTTALNRSPNTRQNTPETCSLSASPVPQPILYGSGSLIRTHSLNHIRKMQSKPPVYKSLFSEAECLAVLDKACLRTAALQDDPSWATHVHVREKQRALTDIG